MADPNADPNGILSSLGGIVTPGTALGALGLGYEAIRGNQQPKGYNQLSQQAATLATQGNQLTAAATGGALPPAAQAQLNQGAQAQQAQVRSEYSRLGLSGSTMESQAMGNIAQQTAAQGLQMQQTLFKNGMAMTGMSDGLYESIMKLNVQQDDAFSKAIGSFAAALAGGV